MGTYETHALKAAAGRACKRSTVARGVKRLPDVGTEGVEVVAQPLLVALEHIPRPEKKKIPAKVLSLLALLVQKCKY